MILEGLVTGMFQGNCYVVGSNTARKAIVIDPGDDSHRILDLLKRLGLEAEMIVCTHSHIDHIAALADVKEATGARVAMHDDAFRTSQGQTLLSQMMMGRNIPALPEPELSLKDGDELSVGELRFKVLFVPGHAPGHVCLYGEGVVFTGDALFAGGIGRFDLPGGDGPLLLRSIREKLLALPEETIVLAGHGPTSTIGQEKKHNPFLLYPRLYMGVDLGDE